MAVTIASRCPRRCATTCKGIPSLSNSVLISRLNAFSLETPDLIAERKRTDEQNRLVAERIAEMERNKVAPEVASERANEIREMLRRKP